MVDAVRRVAQFVTGETVETCVVGIQFGAELGTADFIPCSGDSITALRVTFVPMLAVVGMAI